MNHESKHIITFGSCLSRSIADVLRKDDGYKIIASIHHNRSDAFVRNYIVGDNVLPPLDILLDQLIVSPAHKPGVHQAIRNQYVPYIGKHNLKRSQGLFVELEHNAVDLILIDNYMDITPAMKALKNMEGKELFVNFKFIKNADTLLTHGRPLLSPEESAIAFKQILHFFQCSQPKATIVFIEFPSNAYGDRTRSNRCKLLSEAYSHEFIELGIHHVKQVDVPESLRTHEAQHYKRGYYELMVDKLKSECHLS